MYVIYGRPDCKYCDAAVGLLKDVGVWFKYINISVDQEAKEFLLREGHRTVPQIYEVFRDEDHSHVGGFTDLKAKLSDTDHKKDVPENGILPDH